tara:strand:+ start:247 stop:690 length:444 start_codon:yes stop_codon:yes gene_type:complete
MAKKDKEDKGHKTKAFKKAKDKKEDIKFMEIVHEKKFGDRPKMKKDSPHSTVAGYQSVQQRKEGTKQSKTTSIDKRLKSKTGGRVGLANGGRTNLLEELGRVEAEPSNANRRAEISRVHGELNKGYKTGGRVGFKHGSGRPKGGWTS